MRLLAILLLAFQITYAQNSTQPPVIINGSGNMVLIPNCGKYDTINFRMPADTRRFLHWASQLLLADKKLAQRLQVLSGRVESLVRICRLASPKGYVNIQFLAELLEDGLRDKNTLEAKCNQLQRQMPDPEWMSGFKLLKRRVGIYDDEGFQKSMLKVRDVVLQQPRKFGAFLTYLVALDFKSRYQLPAALVQINDALRLDSSNFDYFVLKGQILCTQSRLDTAMRDSVLHYYQNVLAKQKEKTDTNIARLYGDLGRFFLWKGDCIQALQCLLQSAHEYLICSGEDCAEVATCYYNIGYLYGARKTFDSAEFYYKQAIFRSKSGASRLDLVGQCYNNLGVLSLKRDSLTAAVSWFNSSLAFDKQKYGDSSLITAVAYSNIGLALFRKGALNLALKSYLHALAIRRAKFPKGDLSVAVSYEDVARTYLEERKYFPALAEYRKALSIMTAVTGPESPGTVDTYFYLGVAFYKAGMPDSSLYYLNHYTRCTRLSPVKDIIRQARTFSMIGSIYYKLTRYDSAINSARIAFQLSFYKLGEKDTTSRNQYYTLAKSFMAKDELDSAVLYWNKLLTAEKQNSPRETMTNAAFAHLGMIYILRGDTEMGNSWLCKADLSKIPGDERELIQALFKTVHATPVQRTTRNHSE